MAVPKTGPIVFEFGNLHHESVPVTGAISPADLEAELEHEDEVDLAPAPAPRRASFATPRPPAGPRPPAARLTAKTLLEQAKDRIGELDLELATMAGLQAERDALHRMVSASEPSP